MKRYIVTVPVVGYYVFEAEGEDEQDAIDFAFMNISDILDDGLECIDLVRHITTGNILHAPVNSAYAEELK